MSPFTLYFGINHNSLFTQHVCPITTTVNLLHYIHKVCISANNLIIWSSFPCYFVISQTIPVVQFWFLNWSLTSGFLLQTVVFWAITNVSNVYLKDPAFSFPSDCVSDDAVPPPESLPLHPLAQSVYALRDKNSKLSAIWSMSVLFFHLHSSVQTQAMPVGFQYVFKTRNFPCIYRQRWNWGRFQTASN